MPYQQNARAISDAGWLCAAIDPLSHQQMRCGLTSLITHPLVMRILTVFAPIGMLRLPQLEGWRYEERGLTREFPPCL